VGQLREQDREAVLLRFFKNLSHQEVGAALGLGEDAARKRIDRALEKLREHFARRGVTASSTLLAMAIVENSVQAAPVGLLESVTGASLASIGSVVSGGTTLTALFMTTKSKIILAAVIILAIVATLAVKWRNPSERSVSANVSETTIVKTTPMTAVTQPRTIPAQVAAPVVAPAPVGGSSSVSALDVVASGTVMMNAPPPNADLKTAIPSLAHYLETDDFIHVIPFVMTPAEIQQVLSSKDAASLEDMADMVRAKFNDNTNENIGAVVNALKTIQNKDPILDETGTRAVYQLDPQNPEDKITFLKKDGLWYLY